MQQQSKQQLGRVGASLIIIASLFFLGTVLLVRRGDGLEATAVVLLAAGAGLATTLALATARERAIPRWAKSAAWFGGVLGSIVLFKDISPIAAGMVAATIGLIPTWPRLESWIQGNID